MNKIFIEAQKEDTSECNFLKAILHKYFPDKKVGFVCMNGVGNLFNETNRNQMEQASDEGNNVIVLLDADTPAKGYGYIARLSEINNKKNEFGLNFPLYLYPDNSNDGDVENLMEELARKDLHQEWWNCFEDYEKCVGGVKTLAGECRYELPNRKAKLHTFINSQKLNNSQRRKIGSGAWLFDDLNYWDLSRPSVQPLLNFLAENLQ